MVARKPNTKKKGREYIYTVAYGSIGFDGTVWADDQVEARKLALEDSVRSLGGQFPDEICFYKSSASDWPWGTISIYRRGAGSGPDDMEFYWIREKRDGGTTYDLDYRTGRIRLHSLRRRLCERGRRRTCIRA